MRMLWFRQRRTLAKFFQIRVKIGRNLARFCIYKIIYNINLQGWCRDEKAILRREKEIQKMKQRPTYMKYLSQVPKFAREKGVHPKTPNKYIAYSRRSWDGQVDLMYKFNKQSYVKIKKWKLAIYEWAGETPSPSVNASYCPSECSDEDANSSNSSRAPTPKRIKIEEENHSGESKASKPFNNVVIPSNPDAMASLLGISKV